MIKKLKTTAINIGQVIAILLMFGPMVVIAKIDSLSSRDFWFLLITTILYDIYMYEIIDKISKMKDVKEHYYKFVKNSDKKLNLNLTYKDKFEVLESYVEDLLEKHF